VYRAGEIWFEPPGASDPESRNANKMEPAELLAVVAFDSNDKNAGQTSWSFEVN
jgi:hypothetical protein